jgi:hypothetical protein
LLRAFFEIISTNTSITSDGVEASTIFKKIDAHINKFKFGWNPFKNSAESEISALEKLKTKLLKTNGETVNYVISKWLSKETFEEVKTKNKISTETLIS